MVAIAGLLAVAFSAEAQEEAPPFYRQLQLAVPAYDAAVITAFKTSSLAAGLIIVNTADNGHTGHALTDADVSALRARYTIFGPQTYVLGYVHTRVVPEGALRPLADVQADINGWVTARSVGGGAAKVQVNGIFVDEGQRDCGPTAGDMTWRDYYRAVYSHIASRFTSQPGGTVLAKVALNTGTAIHECYMGTPRAANVFVTFEGDSASYTPAWVAPGQTSFSLLGNVFNTVTGYRLGSEYNDGTAEFMHLIHGTPSYSQAVQNGRTGFSRRNIRWIYTTDDVLVPNPWNDVPSWHVHQTLWPQWANAQ